MLTTFQKSDTEIVEQVVQELRWDCRTETSPIQVFVTDGIVRLTGRVKNYAIIWPPKRPRIVSPVWLPLQTVST